MYKRYFEGKKLILFDLDGTIIKETAEIREQAVEKVLYNLGISHIDTEAYCKGGYQTKTVWESILGIEQLSVNKKIEELVEETHKIVIDIIKNTEMEPIDGFWDLIYELKEEKKLMLGLTTNTDRQTQEIIASKIDISTIFDVVVCGDEVKKPKPDPEIYNKALKLAKIKPSEAIVFEDSLIGVEAAAKAGIDILVIWDGDTPKSLFKGNVLNFSYDFSPYPGSLDDTPVEYIARRYQEEVKSS